MRGELRGAPYTARELERILRRAGVPGGLARGVVTSGFNRRVAVRRSIPELFEFLGIIKARIEEMTPVLRYLQIQGEVMKTESDAVALIDATDVEQLFHLQAQALCDRGVTAETVEVAIGCVFVRRLLETRGGPVAAAEELHRLARTLAAGEPEEIGHA